MKSTHKQIIRYNTSHYSMELGATVLQDFTWHLKKNCSILVCNNYHQIKIRINRIQWNLPERPPLLSHQLTNPLSVKLLLEKLPVSDHLSPRSVETP